MDRGSGFVVIVIRNNVPLKKVADIYVGNKLVKKEVKYLLK